jgi:hypothetical protein
MPTLASILCCSLLCSIIAADTTAAAPSAADAPEPAWARAHLQPPPSAAETRAFMRRLAAFVADHHLKQDPASEQRGLIYEYLDMERRGQSDQFVEGEALDTMHDGAWFAAAMVNAYRATGDTFYKELLTRWQLPFYCKMLNHSDTLFTNKENHARPERQDTWKQNKEWLLQDGEKGFVPYWWDDGGAVSLERRRQKDPRPDYPAFDHFVSQALPNPEYRLHGYSLGSSNHMAQDLGVMLQQAWLLLKDSHEEADRKLAAEVAEAARNLHECRMRHHGYIPMCDAPAALAGPDPELMKHVPDASNPAYWTPGNHYINALVNFKPGQPAPFPGFADDQQYRYYFGIAKAAGQLTKPLAFKTIYDAYTEPMLYRYYADDAAVPSGINRFDLHSYSALDGKLTDYRSDRKGPGGKPRPVGSRMGPQNMVCCGWALQVLRTYPGIWEERYRTQFGQDLRVYIHDPLPGAKAEAVPAARLTAGPVTLNLTSTRMALDAQGECRAAEVVLKLFRGPDAQGSHAILTLHKDRRVTAVNDRGETLACTAEITPAGDGFRFHLVIPYTVVKTQKAWANGVEHGRLSVQVGDVTRNLYLASGEAQVKAWLEHELAGGLRTWEAIFKERGYIPTGLGTGQFWDNYSDTGGYAHLISAAAEWLLCLDGKKDWEVHRVPAVGIARPTAPLPGGRW